MPAQPSQLPNAAFAPSGLGCQDSSVMVTSVRVGEDQREDGADGTDASCLRARGA